MFAVYVNPVIKEPDGVLCFKETYLPVEDFGDFCIMLDTVLDCYHSIAISSEIDSCRNCVMILTDNNTLKICVEPNYRFNCMNYVTLEEIKNKVDNAINKHITHICSRCGHTEDVCFDNLKEMSNEHRYLPDDWEEAQGSKLCPACAKEYRKILSDFLKNDSKDS